ncbi:MAG TPA: carboxypeptidase-like regulatory domain-containing protein [Spirochaetota bacterium]|nr:carboxypeptidase-like regulatory domain-containing protein [Spirochaetota bacterium]
MLKKIVLNGALIAIGVFFLSCDTAEVKRLSDGRSLYGGDSKKLSGKSAIEGYVIDTVTKKGIKNAKVEIKNANMGVGYYLRETEWNGYFKIDDFIPYIKYMVEVSAEGYVTYTSTGAVSEGSHKIELRPESVLTGTVCNSRGEPLRALRSS